MAGEQIPDQRLHVLFLPFLGNAHRIPIVDMAKLFASRGVKTTIVTTPLNASFFSSTIERANKESGIDIGVEIIKFPTLEVGLPEGCECTDIISSSQMENKWELINKFNRAIRMLQQPFEQLLQECKPDCLIADVKFPWATDAANQFGIPRLVFHVQGFFAISAEESIRLHKPHMKVESDSEPFLVSNLPGDIKFTRNQLPDYLKQDIESEFAGVVKASLEAELKSFGVVVNSFYELEATYVDYYRNVLGRKAWHIGPLSLSNKANIDKAERGKKSAIDEHECLKWLDSKKPNSVLYICFGGMANFKSLQLKEIAMALEALEFHFIWVVKKQKNNEDEEDDWLPEGFEKRTEGKGLTIRGWAPQVVILGHQSIGGFVTHCGWNSMLEGLCAGVPMVTWPLFADQFYIEKLVTQVLKIGVSVGTKKWVRVVGDFVKREAIEKAVKELMKGDRAEEMRNKTKALAEASKKAVENGGSSYSDLDALIEEISSRRH